MPHQENWRLPLLITARFVESQKLNAVLAYIWTTTTEREISVGGFAINAIECLAWVGILLKYWKEAQCTFAIARQ